MTNINERVRLLRKDLGLTQIEFGQRIAVSQGHLTAIENGKREVTDKTVKVICMEFNVREEWLRTGGGEMYKNVDASILSQLRARYGLNDRQLALVENYLSLPDKMRDAVVDIAKHLAAEPSAAAKIAAPAGEEILTSSNKVSNKPPVENDAPGSDPEIEAQVALYRQTLLEVKREEAEKQAKSSSLRNIA